MGKQNIAAAALLFISNIAIADNLVENGSFENTSVIQGSWSYLNELPHWELTGSRGAKFEVQTSRLNIIEAQHGSQYVELDSTNNYGIRQNILTETGASYEIKFYYSPRMNNRASTNRVEVLWNGHWVQTLQSSRKGWQEFTFNVIANSPITSFELRGAGRSESYGGFVDNVSIKKVITEPLACEGGLYGINNYGSVDSGVIFHFDLADGSATQLSGIPSTASNIASHDGKLYFVEQLSSKSRESRILGYDIEQQQLFSEVATNSYPIYRSVINADGESIRATSKTYMYDFDLASGQKSVLGKMVYSGDSFKHGDIEYDGETLYVLTGQALYTIDPDSMELTELFKHSINWASGFAIGHDNKAYVSGRKEGENARIYQLDLDTGAATELFETSGHINDLTFVDNFCQIN